MSAGLTFRVALASLGLALGAHAPAPWASVAAAFRPSTAPAERAPQIVVRVGGDLAARTGNYVDVPVTVDMTGAPGRSLGAYRLRLVTDPAQLSYSQVLSPSGFAEPLVNTDSVYSSGVLKLTALRPGGATGVITLFTIRFYVYTDAAPSAITLDLQELTEAGTFADLLPLAQVVDGVFCRSLGTWGDTDFDGVSNSRDGLIALSKVVGLPADTLVVDTIFNGEGYDYDTLLIVQSALADVDADGNVTSRDALIILSNSVGLPVTGFRIGLPAAGACGTGAASTLVVLPDSIELQRGQQVQVQVQARDESGRVVPAASLTWRSSNSVVAAFVNDYYNPRVEARDAGVAVLTAELGPGVRGTLKVVVLARRRNWFVDVGRSLYAPTQTGTAALPFAFIGDAMSVASDGDTVHVAGGVYEERVSASVSVVLLGDSLNRPIIDSRLDGCPSCQTVSAGSPAGTMELAHLIVRGNGIYLEGHANIVRDVRVDSAFGDLGEGGGVPAIEILSQASVQGAARPGPRAAPGQRDLGRAVVENVVINRYNDDGIEIDQADSAFVRNNQILRDSVGTYPYCGSPQAITVSSVNFSEVRNNVITNAQCVGIEVLHDAGRAVIAGNRVTNAAGAGIRVSAPIVVLEHNAVRNVGTPTLYTGYARGIEVSTNFAVVSLTSLGDTVIGSDHTGFSATAAVGTIDSLVVDTTGRDSSFGSYGLELQSGRYTLRHNHLSNTLQGDGMNICGDIRMEVTTIGNRISNARYNGINIAECGESGSRPDTLISVHDTVSVTGIGIYADQLTLVQVDSADLTGQLTVYQGGVHVNGGRLVVRDSRIRGFEAGVAAYNGERTVEIRRNAFIANGNGVYLDTPLDSTVIVGNTVDSSSTTGLEMYFGAAARVDSNVVRVSGLNGIRLGNLTGQTSVSGNTVDSTALEAIHVYSGLTARVTRNTITRSGLSGLLLAAMSDTVFATGNTITGSGVDGIWVYASLVHADSNKLAANTNNGINFGAGGSGRAEFNRFQGNGAYGIFVDASSPFTSPSAANNVIQGNVVGGAINLAYPNTTTVDADSNYWGDPFGPRCKVEVTGVDCAVTNGATVGDSVVSAGIIFMPFLPSAPSGVPAAPRVLASRNIARVRTGAAAPSAPTSALAAGERRAALAQREQARAEATRQQAAQRPPSPAVTPRAARLGPRAFPNAWQKGRQPSAPRPARSPVAP